MIDYLLDSMMILGYTWTFDGVQRTPTKEDLEQTLDRAKELLYAEPVPSQLEIGHIIVRRWSDDKFDVYLHLGEI